MITELYMMLMFVLLMVGLAAALLFGVRLLCSLSSPKIVEQMRRYPRLHFVWGCLAALGVLMFLSPGSLRPPAWLQRREQRKLVLERIQSAGGWPAVRQGCEWLLAKNPAFSEWRRPATNIWVYPNPQTELFKRYVTNFDWGPLPPAVAALKPMWITCDPPRRPRQLDKEEPALPIVRITIWPTHSVSPPYALAVVCGTNAQSYAPPSSTDGLQGYRSPTYRKVAAGVYEVY